MNKIKNYFKISTGIIFGATLVLALGAIFFVSVPQTKAAEYPNILVSENMTIGTTGQGVVVLQGLLSELGYLNVPAGIPFGYYGSMTRNAVAAYQARHNVYPPVGYYGPLTKVAMHSEFSSRGWLNLLGW